MIVTPKYMDIPKGVGILRGQNRLRVGVYEQCTISQKRSPLPNLSGRTIEVVPFPGKGLMYYSTNTLRRLWEGAVPPTHGP